MSLGKAADEIICEPNSKRDQLMKVIKGKARPITLADFIKNTDIDEIDPVFSERHKD